MKLYKSGILSLASALVLASCGTGDNKVNNMDVPADTVANTNVSPTMSTDTMSHTPPATPPIPDTNTTNRMNGTSTSNGVAPQDGRGR